MPLRSRSAKRFQSTRQEATGLEPSLECGVGDDGFAAALGYHGEVVQVFKQLLIFIHRQDYRYAVPFFVYDEPIASDCHRL
jgi:hypothetical protein